LLNYLFLSSFSTNSTQLFIIFIASFLQIITQAYSIFGNTP
jgi:hypothetical protein